MKSKISLLLIVLILTSLACSFTIPANQEAVIQQQTLNVSVPAPLDKSETHATIHMGAGNLTLSGGSDKLVEGNIVYNVASLAPNVVTGDHSVTIGQTAQIHGMPGKDITNIWNLSFGRTPLDLAIQAGAYTGSMELGGIPLTQLSIRDGASKDTINFGQPNPVKMSRLEYYTGASDVEINHLANANFDEMRFEGGAGNFKLDFSGTLQRDAHVQIIGGVNNIQITVPQGMPVTINLAKSLSNVETDGTWTIHNKVYQTSGSGPHITMDIENGMANLNLIQK